MGLPHCNKIDNRFFSHNPMGPCNSHFWFIAKKNETFGDGSLTSFNMEGLAVLLDELSEQDKAKTRQLANDHVLYMARDVPLKLMSSTGFESKNECLVRNYYLACIQEALGAQSAVAVMQFAANVKNAGQMILTRASGTALQV